MQLEECNLIGKMLIKDADGTVVRTCIYPCGALVLSYSEVNFNEKEAERAIVLKVASRPAPGNYGYFQKTIQLIRGQYCEFEPVSDNADVPLDLFS